MSMTGLNQALAKAMVLDIDASSKLIIFSDCHRGDNSWADDFAHNQSLFFHALNHYLKEGFTYIELGDGDELWENSDFSPIRKAHSHVFSLMRAFYTQGRLYMVFGNHDGQRRSPAYVRKTLSSYYDERTRSHKPLFPDITVYEAIRLRYAGGHPNLLLLHGHQADTINSKWWRLSCYVVRHFWRPLQLLGVNDPTSPAQNFKKRTRIEASLERWARRSNHMLIAGHTHRPRFPDQSRPPYFNTGSCVHPRCITGIEIEAGAVQLIKWDVWPDSRGRLLVRREIIDGPRRLV